VKRARNLIDWRRGLANLDPNELEFRRSASFSLLGGPRHPQKDELRLISSIAFIVAHHADHRPRRA
jgi:hypothetical protein